MLYSKDCADEYIDRPAECSNNHYDYAFRKDFKLKVTGQMITSDRSMFKVLT